MAKFKIQRKNSDGTFTDIDIHAKYADTAGSASLAGTATNASYASTSGTASKVTNKLTINGNEYDGSSAVDITTPNDNTTYTFTGGTNKITVTPSNGSSVDVSVTPYIQGMISGYGTSGYLAKFDTASSITSAVAFNSADKESFLRHDGTWGVPSGIQYSFSGDDTNTISIAASNGTSQSVTINNVAKASYADTCGVAESAETAETADSASVAAQVGHTLTINGTAFNGSKDVSMTISGGGSSVSCTLNGSSTTSPSWYAPTSAGTKGNILKSNGSGAPTWDNIQYISSLSNGAAKASSYGNLMWYQYIKMPDSSGYSLLIQWGQRTPTSSSTPVVTFSKSYNYIPTVIVSVQPSADTQVQRQAPSVISTTGFTLGYNTVKTPFAWVAFGFVKL